MIADTLRDIEAVAEKLNITPTKLHTIIARWEKETNVIDISDRHPIVRRQWISLEVVDCIYSMTWRVIVSELDLYFLTSDNPVFFDEGLGLTDPHSEVTFPLGSNVALHASWQGPPADLLFVNATTSLVGELNLRTSYRARFAFYHAQSCAIASLISAERPQPHAISWAES